MASVTDAAEPPADRDRGKSSAGDRAFRGLALAFLLSFLNLAGLSFTVMSIGGFGAWTPVQFAALFGIVEAAAGLACVLLPNVWHMPIAELETPHRTQVRLAATSLLLPHWGSAARTFAGGLLIGFAAWRNGIEIGALLVVPGVLLIAGGMLALSLFIARLGVAKPDTDVVQFSIRWRGAHRELKPISISASMLQFVLGICTLPLAKLLAPSVLFAPGLRPSDGFVVAAALFCAVSIALGLGAWAGRISWHAPREQQQEIEAKA